MKAFRELARISGRQTRRLRLIFERRKLARLEAALGLLGWQQADYDGEAQEEVHRLTAYEREQARLTNESAQYGLEIRKLEEQREFEADRCARAQEILLRGSPTNPESVEAAEDLLNAKRKEIREIEARLPVIERELRDAETQYRALVGPRLPTPEVRAQILQWQKVIMALPREKAEWSDKSREVAREAAGLETLLGKLREARDEFEARHREISEQVSERQRAKRKVEKQIESLEKAKDNPYREIGRTLADHAIAPLNQPEALTAVLQQRRKIAGLEEAIATSLAESARDAGGAALQMWIVALAGGALGSEVIAFLAIDG